MALLCRSPAAKRGGLLLVTEAVWKRGRWVGVRVRAALGCDADEHTVCRLKGIDVCRSGLGPHEGNQHRRAEDLQHPLQVIGEDVQTHFRSNPWQGPGEEVGRTHPRLQRPERVLYRLPA